jgi:hypothetical protein
MSDEMEVHRVRDHKLPFECFIRARSIPDVVSQSMVESDASG